MANNLSVNYDLMAPGQKYDRVIAEIKKLGPWARVTLSCWYVKSDLTASQALDRVRAVADRNDKFFVIDATNNNAAWVNLTPEVEELLLSQWNAVGLHPNLIR